MADINFTLTTFYNSWKEYQDHIKGALAPLTAEQLELRAASHLRSIGENALHIIGCRAGWFTYVLREDVGDDVKEYTSWDDPGAPPPNARRADASPRPHLAVHDRLPVPLESQRYAPNLPRRLGRQNSPLVARLDRLACARA
jgi:hypothetical protein